MFSKTSVNLFVLILVIIDGSQLICALQFPSTLPQCKAGDTECLPRVMTSIIQASGAGNKELNLLPIDPLFLEKFSILQSENSPVNIQLHFRNLTLSGLKDIVINRVVGFDINPNTSKFEVFGKTKRLAILGKYSIAGKVLFLPITGNGFANLTFENVNIHVKVFPKVETREGEEHIRIEKVKVVFTTSRFIPYFQNLFNDEFLSKNMNKFLQENSMDIFNEVKVSIEKAVSDVIKLVLSGPFNKFPYKDIFLADN